MRGTNVEERVAREALFGSLPILSNERLYGFVDALLLLSGYCIATWSYTQGAYLAPWWDSGSCCSAPFSGPFSCCVSISCR